MLNKVIREFNGTIRQTSNIRIILYVFHYPHSETRFDVYVSRNNKLYFWRNTFSFFLSFFSPSSTDRHHRRRLIVKIESS